ncbi:hypothetical protein RFI_07955, partial [Reticulomyxa filosa]
MIANKRGVWEKKKKKMTKKKNDKKVRMLSSSANDYSNESQHNVYSICFHRKYIDIFDAPSMIQLGIWRELIIYFGAWEINCDLTHSDIFGKKSGNSSLKRKTTIKGDNQGPSSSSSLSSLPTGHAKHDHEDIKKDEKEKIVEENDKGNTSDNDKENDNDNDNDNDEMDEETKEQEIMIEKLKNTPPQMIVLGDLLRIASRHILFLYINGEITNNNRFLYSIRFPFVQCISFTQANPFVQDSQ